LPALAAMGGATAAKIKGYDIDYGNKQIKYFAKITAIYLLHGSMAKLPALPSQGLCLKKPEGPLGRFSPAGLIFTLLNHNRQERRQ